MQQAGEVSAQSALLNTPHCLEPHARSCSAAGRCCCACAVWTEVADAKADAAILIWIIV